MGHHVVHVPQRGGRDRPSALRVVHEGTDAQPGGAVHGSEIDLHGDDRTAVEGDGRTASRMT
jgi:hypothetical protein